MTGSQFYISELVADGLWRIDDNGVHMYLVEGVKRALLIDTGYGRADLAGYLKTLTDLPVSVVNTHAHPDHEGGNGQFSRVHMHSADTPYSRFRDGPCTIVHVGEGFMFDLGNRSLMVLENPGHTPGSISLWEDQEGILFSGDSLGANTHWLFLSLSLPLGVYQNSIRQYQDMVSSIKTIYPSHDMTPIGTEYIADILDCVGQIIANPLVGQPFESFAGSALCHRHGRASVAYDASKAY
jgi:hydroxyacylglutathione hydrolase